MTNYTTTRLQAEEVEREALRWAGPFGYAVLQVLRMTDFYSDADFQALMERGRREMGQPTTLTLTYPPTPADTSHPVAGMVVDPAPGADYYRRAKPTPAASTRPGSPAAPPGTRDASGRLTRRVP